MFYVAVCQVFARVSAQLSKIGGVRLTRRGINKYLVDKYRNHRGLRTLRGRLFKCFRSQIFIAQGCGDADMCEVTDTCA